jgi:hypothetical protein
MNLNALKISLRSLIQSGNRINEGDVDEMFIREYIELYGKTKEYLEQATNQDESLSSLFKKLPDIKFESFHNPYYLFKSYLLDNVRWGYRSTGGPRMSDLFEIDTYPARTKYLNELTVNILNINSRIIEIIKIIENNLQPNQ